MKFENWLAEVSRILQLLGHQEEDLDHDAWKEYYDDKDTPAMAVQHDLIAAL